MFTSLAQTTAVSEKHRRLPIISECFAIKKIHVAVNYKQSVLGAFIDVHTSSSQGWLVRLFKLSRVQANKSLSAANDKSPTQVRLSARLSTAITENPFATIGDYSLSYFLAFSMRLETSVWASWIFLFAECFNNDIIRRSTANVVSTLMRLLANNAKEYDWLSSNRRRRNSGQQSDDDCPSCHQLIRLIGYIQNQSLLRAARTQVILSREGSLWCRASRKRPRVDWRDEKINLSINETNDLTIIKKPFDEITTAIQRKKSQRPQRVILAHRNFVSRTAESAVGRCGILA